MRFNDCWLLGDSDLYCTTGGTYRAVTITAFDSFFKSARIFDKLYKPELTPVAAWLQETLLTIVPNVPSVKTKFDSYAEFMFKNWWNKVTGLRVERHVKTVVRYDRRNEVLG